MSWVDIRDWLWESPKKLGLAAVVTGVLLAVVVGGAVVRVVTGSGAVLASQNGAVAAADEDQRCGQAAREWAERLADRQSTNSEWTAELGQRATARSRIWYRTLPRQDMPTGGVSVHGVNAEPNVCDAEVSWASGHRWFVTLNLASGRWLVDGWTES